MARPAYILGVDAGATRSRFLLARFDGEEVGREQGPAFNLRQSAPRELRALVDRYARELLAAAEVDSINLRAIAIGAAGAGTTGERDQIRELVQSRYPHSHVYVHHDAFIAHHGALGGGTGVIVIAGTGSIAYGRSDDGREARAGGWGWLLGDEGGGWWIGRELIRAALAAWEGSGPDTSLTDLLCDRFDLDDAYAVIPRLYAGELERRQFTALAQPAAEHARAGDEVAVTLFTRAGRELGALAVRAARKLEIPPGALTVAMLGGVAEGAADLLEPGVREALDEFALRDPGPETRPRLVQPEADAVTGAVNWARDRLLKRSFA